MEKYNAQRCLITHTDADTHSLSQKHTHTHKHSDSPFDSFHVKFHAITNFQAKGPEKTKTFVLSDH